MFYHGYTIHLIGSHMDLRTYFLTTKRAQREEFAVALEVNVDYLYHCSRGKRKPGTELCKRIVSLDPRFTLGELRPDIWGDGIDAMAASDDTQSPTGTSSRNLKEMRA
ncbi:MAG TPA: hypothetical protein VF534_27120 [Paraburkholderia sp.]